MKNKFTCNTCVDPDGRALSTCQVRSECPDDATSTERRKQVITELF